MLNKMHWDFFLMLFVCLRAQKWTEGHQCTQMGGWAVQESSRCLRWRLLLPLIQHKASVCPQNLKYTYFKTRGQAFFFFQGHTDSHVHRKIWNHLLKKNCTTPAKAGLGYKPRVLVKQKTGLLSSDRASAYLFCLSVVSFCVMQHPAVPPFCRSEQEESW